MFLFHSHLTSDVAVDNKAHPSRTYISRKSIGNVKENIDTVAKERQRKRLLLFKLRNRSKKKRFIEKQTQAKRVYKNWDRCIEKKLINGWTNINSEAQGKRIAHKQRIEEDYRQARINCNNADISNPFVVLGIPIYATRSEVKRAFKNLSFKYHPDKSVSDLYLYLYILCFKIIYYYHQDIVMYYCDF